MLINCTLLLGSIDILDEYHSAKYATKQYIKNLAAAALPPIKFSYVFNDNFLTDYRDGEILKKNRGFSVKTFSNKSEAIEWLLYSN